MQVLMLAILTGCWEKKVKNLSNVEFDHYYALRVYMDDDQRKTYLKMKTEEERNAYLQELGHWDRFYSYEDRIRELIIAGEVQPGWTKDMLYMAWGSPYDRTRLAGRKAVRSELLTYRFEVQEDGTVLLWEPGSKTEYKAVRLFIREIILDDDNIIEIREENTSW
ncbi:MAG: hypothetical protein ACI8RZ_006623 [Myxococcota bacterium]|jgi:hypothetical protein